MATMLSGSGVLPCRAPTTRSVPPATGRAPSASAERASSTVAAETNAEVNGPARPQPPRRARASSAARERGRRSTFAIAFAIAPGVGTVGGSPTPFVPFGPPFSAGVSIQSTSMRGASDAVTSL